MSSAPGLNDLSIPASQAEVAGIIDRGCEFEGNLCFRGTVRIGGAFRGQIYTPDTLIIAEGAKINAQISAGVVIISGEVNGSIQAKHRVEIHRPAVFRGDIFTPSLSVEEGVIFEGSSKMAHVPPTPAKSFLSPAKS